MKNLLALSMLVGMEIGMTLLYIVPVYLSIHFFGLGTSALAFFILILGTRLYNSTIMLIKILEEDRNRE